MFYFISKNIRKGLYGLTNQKGFSLIELMVVVAIIGILAVVAIPNFQKFQRRAKQTEAKTHLGGIYTTLQAFIAEHGVGTPNLTQMGYQPTGAVTYDVGWNSAQSAATGIANPNKATADPGYRGPTVIAANQNQISTHQVASEITLGADKDSSGGTLNVRAFVAQTQSNCSGSTPVPPETSTTCSASQTTCADATKCGAGTSWTPAVASTPGSEVVNNVGIGRVNFRIGASGNIGGSNLDEWTMTEAKSLKNDQDGTD